MRSLSNSNQGFGHCSCIPICIESSAPPRSYAGKSTVPGTAKYKNRVASFLRKLCKGSQYIDEAGKQAAMGTWHNSENVPIFGCLLCNRECSRSRAATPRIEGLLQVAFKRSCPGTPFGPDALKRMQKGKRTQRWDPERDLRGHFSFLS